MKIAVMQPYFFPYLGYFSLIAASDYWIYFDTPQYIRHGWVNRNRILKPSKEDWQYITVPLEKHSRNEQIMNVYPKNNNWQAKLLAQLEHYRKAAPFYKEVYSLVADVVNYAEPGKSISSISIKSVEAVCEYCGLELRSEVFSQMNLDIGTVSEPDEWALEITRSLQGTTYINPIGGKEFFSKEKYREASIELHFLKPIIQSYDQKNKKFIPRLSIIDTLMVCSPNDVKDMIKKYELC